MTYSNPAAYRRFMGRWSAQLAPLFVRFVGIEDGRDVGCGTGSLSTALLPAGPAVRVVGIDPVPDYVSFTREVVADHRADFNISTAEALPFSDATFDAALALTEHFELARVRLAFGPTERVDGRADPNVHETAILYHLLPGCTRLSTGDSGRP